MSQIISDILGYDPNYVRELLDKLERANTGAPVDVQLIGDVHAHSARFHRALSLDPSDTEPREFYAALRSRVRADNERLARAIGGQHADAVSEMTPLIVRAIQRLLPKQCWVLKTSVIKDVLISHPPIRTMEALGYRSVKSLVKREQADVLLVIARYLEDQAWNQSVIEMYADLSPSDFEIRPLRVVALDKMTLIEPLEKTEKQHHLVLHSKESGVVGLAPTREKVVRNYTLRTIALIVYYVGEIQAMSSILRYAHADKKYGEFVKRAFIDDTTGHFSLGGHRVHWRSLYAMMAAEDVHSIPHMHGHDWSYYRPNSIVAELDKGAGVWNGAHYAAKLGSGLVSCNLVDLSLDENRQTAYEDRSLHYLRREFENEFFGRYIAVDPIKSVVLLRMGIPYEL